MNDIRFYGVDSSRIQRTLPTQRQAETSGQTAVDKKAFREVLQQTIQKPKITWSKHAQMRLEMANIDWNEQKETQLASAVDQAAAKGGRSSLVFMSDVAFVVSVPNRTVVTAVESGRMQDHVFTQIDSAVIVPK